MRRTASVVLCLLLAWVGPGASATTDSGGSLVGEDPVAGTPHVLDGEVLSVAQVGGTVVLGGTFTRARNDGSETELPRRGLLAFDAATGQIDPFFHPDPDGVVNVVEPGPAGTVYVGGDFSFVAGQPRLRLAQLALAGGTVVPGFDAGKVSGPVRDLRLRRGKLWAAGQFTRIGGRRDVALAVLSARTGTAKRQPQLRIRGQARKGLGRTTVAQLDLSPNGRYLALIGNFRSVQGERRVQLAVLDLRRGAAPTSFRTRFYTALCVTDYFSYVRDVAFAPDGSFFVVATSGGPLGPDSPCDSVARFETRGTDRAARPSWIASTGGDTVQAVEVTAGAVYVGGHQRWFNNPFGSNSPGPGAVGRQGIAALSPVNGLPFRWNPGRSRGIGVGDLLATGAGLWIGSDTDRIHEQLRSRIALLPAGGATYPAVAPPARASAIYRVEGDRLVRRTHRGHRSGAAVAVAPGAPNAPDWASAAGAFVLAGQLYVAGRDGSFTRRAFDGAGYGPPEPVSGSDALVPLLDWRAELAATTGMFYDKGRIYFTLAGSGALYYRYFNPESGVVGAMRLVATSHRAGGFAPRKARGLFVAGRHLHWTTSNGRLRRTGWSQTAQAAVPKGEPSVVGGPKVDRVRWGPGVVFVGPTVGRGG